MIDCFMVNKTIQLINHNTAASAYKTRIPDEKEGNYPLFTQPRLEMIR